MKTQTNFLANLRYIAWRRQWHPTPVLLPGKSHGWRSLGGCSPWGHWGSDTTEWLHFHFSLSCTGEGNGNPLQCSCLENPRDRGAWWAAVYRVAQSRTWLKWLSSSSSRAEMTQNPKKNSEWAQKDQQSAKLSRWFLSLRTSIIGNGEPFKALNRGRQSDLLLQRLLK